MDLKDHSLLFISLSPTKPAYLLFRRLWPSSSVWTQNPPPLLAALFVIFNLCP